jgi:hypothetical protein
MQSPLRGRLMVGRLTLDQVVKVRVLAPQPRKAPAQRAFLFSGRAALVRGGNVGGNSRPRCYGRPRAGRRNTDVQPLNRRRRSRRYAPRYEASNRDAAKHPADRSLCRSEQTRRRLCCPCAETSRALLRCDAGRHLAGGAGEARRRRSGRRSFVTHGRGNDWTRCYRRSKWKRRLNSSTG